MALPAIIEVNVGKSRIVFTGRILVCSSKEDRSIYVEDLTEGEWTGWWPQATVSII